jgi:hypothetical protein
LLEKLERESGISSNESQDLVRGANQKCAFVGLEYYNSLFIYLFGGRGVFSVCRFPRNEGRVRWTFFLSLILVSVSLCVF